MKMNVKDLIITAYLNGFLKRTIIFVNKATFVFFLNKHRPFLRYTFFIALSDAAL